MDLQISTLKKLYRKFDLGQIVQFIQTWMTVPNQGEINVELYYEIDRDKVWIDFGHPKEVRIVNADTKLSDLLRFLFQIDEDENFFVYTAKTGEVQRVFYEDFLIQGEHIKEASLYDIRQALPVYQMEVKI